MFSAAHVMVGFVSFSFQIHPSFVFLHSKDRWRKTHSKKNLSRSLMFSEPDADADRKDVSSRLWRRCCWSNTDTNPCAKSQNTLKEFELTIHANSAHVCIFHAHLLYTKMYCIFITCCPINWPLCLSTSSIFSPQQNCF